jgi:hypothetical protein
MKRKNVGHDNDAAVIKDETAVAVADAPAEQANLLDARRRDKMETALAVTQNTVSKESLLTPPTLAEMLDAGMTNPTVMTVHELAPIVIVGCIHLRNYIPYIHTFLQKCEDLPRDSKNRWIVPVEDCYSIKEFFENKCNRTPQAVYEQIRRYEKAEKERLTGTVTVPKTKKTMKQEPTTIIVQEGVPAAAVAAAIEAAVEQYKDKRFEEGRLTERMLQEKQAAEAEANGTGQDEHILVALKFADTFARNIAVAVNSSGTVNDKKAVKVARKAAVQYCKLRGIPFNVEPTQEAAPSYFEPTAVQE